MFYSRKILSDDRNCLYKLSRNDSLVTDYFLLRQSEGNDNANQKKYKILFSRKTTWSKVEKVNIIKNLLTE